MPSSATAGATAKSEPLSVVTLKLTVWPASFAGPGEMSVAQAATVWAPASSSTVWSPPGVKLGASLTAPTLTAKVCGALVSLPPLAVPPSSVATTVTMALPEVSGAML